MFNDVELDKIHKLARVSLAGSNLPEIYQLGMSEEEFVEYLWEMYELTGLSLDALIDRVISSDFNLYELRGLAELCEDEESKFKFCQIPSEVYQKIRPVDLAGIVRYINANYKYPRVCENIRTNFFVPNQKGLSSTIANWVKKEEAYYERMARILDSYLPAEARQSSSKPKLVVQNVDYYRTREDYVDAVVACISGIQDNEIYEAEKIGNWVDRLKGRQNEKLARFIQSYYGINYIEEFKKKLQAEREERKAQLERVFDDYLVAEKREGRFESKIVVKSIEDYSSEEDYKRDVVQCLGGVSQLEEFRGVPIGKILYELRIGSQVDACRILSERYGIDIQSELAKVHEKKFEQKQTHRDLLLEAISKYLTEEQREDGTRKVVVKVKRAYDSEEAYDRAIIMCLDQVGVYETYMGYDIGRIMQSMKKGQSPVFAKQLSQVLGVDVVEGLSRVGEYYKEALLNYVEEYLVAEKRENFDEQKRVVGRRESYPSIERYRDDVVRVLSEIMDKETFKGWHVKCLFASKERVRVINEHFGIDYFKDKVRVEEADLAKFWDSYLEAPKRENKRAPKIVVRAEEEYYTPRGRKDDIVRVIDGIIQAGEEFKGVNIGMIRTGVARGKYTNLINFLNRHYGIDLLSDMERLSTAEEWHKRQVCEKYGIKYTEHFRKVDIRTINRNLKYITKRFGERFVTRDTLTADYHNMVLIMDYLDRCGMLDVVLTCPYVLSMTVEEFQEREIVTTLRRGNITKVNDEGVIELDRTFILNDEEYGARLKLAMGASNDLNRALKSRLRKGENVVKGLIELADGE